MSASISRLILFSILLLSCNVYTPPEIASEGETILKNHSDLYEEIARSINDISVDSSKIYHIRTSSTTDYFSFRRMYYDTSEQVAKTDELISMDDNIKSLIEQKLLKTNSTKLIFVKDIYVAFELGNVRDNNFQYAQLVYIKDLEVFLNLFPNHFIYRENQTIPANKKDEFLGWIYLYNNKWGITTGTDYFYKAPTRKNIKIAI